LTDLRSPIRTCIACRARRDQAALLRFRRRRDGVVVPAVGRRDATGRSAYVCPSPVCVVDAVRRRALERALGRASVHRTAEPAPKRRRGAPALVVRVPEARELQATTVAALDREIDLLTRTGPLCGSPPHGARSRLQGLRDALGQPGRND
jgi:predicted RNA-binding protein YlxR (DUF448 family)